MHVNWAGEPATHEAERHVTAALPALVRNPFAVPPEMNINRDLSHPEGWRPYDQQYAVETFERHQTPTMLAVELRANYPYPLFISLCQYPRLVGALIDLDNAYFSAGSSPDAATGERLSTLVTLTHRVAYLLPAFTRALAGSDQSPADLIEAEHLPNLPGCFVYVAWYHLVSPLGYERFYTQEDLLRAPAYSVRELEQGWIEIVSYADPWSYATRETQERIIALTHYLDQCRRDRANAEPLRILP